MMPLFWIVLWSVLPFAALISGPDRCSVRENNNSQNSSPLLDSLQCHNDYESYVHCKWRNDGDPTLQLWFKTELDRKLCVPYSPQFQDEQGTVQCRYKTDVFSIGIKHTVFYIKKQMATVCTSVPHKPLDLSQHLRARPPVDLSTHDAGDGGRRLHWSSPYPPPSSLNKNLTYQLSYRTDRQDNWTTEDVSNTNMKLEKRLLLPGHRYEARVRARASMGQWSDWSHVVTWKTEEDTGQFPSFHCVLDGEKKATCSWEVSREVAYFITYQLACRHNQTTPSERCCIDTAVSSDPSGTMLRYSCSLSVADSAHLLLELLPTRNAKTFEAYQHIRPNPPQQVKVKEKHLKWIVEWTEPSTASKLKLYYQVCYYRQQDQGCSTLQNILDKSMSLPFHGASLDPSQKYMVKVRSLVAPGQGSRYEGIPSEWTDPVTWTTNAAGYSITTLVYVSFIVFVTIVIVYYTIPACQRQVILWVDSVPSPGKSKILCEMESTTIQALLQTEHTSVCKVLQFDTVSTSSSDASLWPTSNNKHSAEKVNSSTTSINFSGPYILCQTSEPDSKSVDVEPEETQKEEKTLSDVSPMPVNFALHGEGHVCLPNCSVSRSVHDLVSHADANTNSHKQTDTTLEPDKTDVQINKATSRDQPLPHISGPFTLWPHSGTINSTGYCHLPQPN